MTFGITAALGAALFAFLISGARSAAYGLFYLAFLPFLTLDPSQGGLVAIDGLQGGNVAWKLGVRALSTAGLLAIAVRMRGSVLTALARPSSLPVLALFAWALLGLPRAQDPWVSFFRLGELLAFFVIGLVLAQGAARNAAPERVVRFHCLALLPVLIVTVAFALAQPEIAFHESTDGIRRMGHKFMNSNVLGFAATVVILWATSTIKTGLLLRGLARPERPDSAALGRRLGPLRALAPWILSLGALALGAYVQYHARSRTAMLTALLGVGLIWLPWPTDAAGAGKRRTVASRRRLGLAAGLVLGALVIGATSGQLQEWFMRGASAADIASGTGRTGLWQELLLVQVPKAPLLGAGYLNLSGSGGFEHAGHAWNNAHNTYLFALVSTGIPGLLCVTLIIFLPLVASLKRAMTPPHPGAPLHGAIRAQEAWALIFALQCIVALASVTGFGVAGYPNVAMLFHYGLYGWVMSHPRSPSPQPAKAPFDASKGAGPKPPRAPAPLIQSTDAAGFCNTSAAR